MLKGPPVFYPTDDRRSSTPEDKKVLINFHNTLNKNLFSKKNYKVMKKFYTTNNFYNNKTKKEDFFKAKKSSKRGEKSTSVQERISQKSNIHKESLDEGVLNEN